MIKIEVPASTSNLGIGFDSIGMALELKNTFVFTKADQYQVSNFNEEFGVDNNLVITAYKKVFEELGIKEIPVKVRLDENEIPVSRGLGSSSSCIIAGVMAANYFLGNCLSVEDCTNLATKIEGHPDNIAPSILGGLVASYIKANKVITTKYPIDSSLLFFALIPDFTVETKKARAVLPNEVPFQDVVHTISRAIQLPQAFAVGDIDLIKDVFDDRIHQPYRMPLIDSAESIKEMIKDYDAGLCISGSGPTLLLVTKHPLIVDHLVLDDKWIIRPVKVCFDGVKITEV